MRRVIWASLRYRRARLALSCLAIVLGTAFVAGSLMLGASVKQSFFGGFAAGAANVSAIVAAPRSGNPPGQYGGPTVPASALDQVRAAPGVAAAAGRLTGPATLLGADGKPIGDGLGINVPDDPALRGFSLITGHLPASAGQVDVDRATAADEGLRLGQRVRVVSAAGVIRPFVLVGIIDLGVSSQIGNNSVTAFETPVAFAVTGQAGYGLIVARADPGLSQAALAAGLAGTFPRDHVQTGSQFGSEEANSAAHVARQLTTGLLIFAMVAVVVACIVVYNTFGILIAQRSREMALLRCVGASRGQVFAGLLAESAAVGLIASLAGVAAGAGLTWVLQRLLTGVAASELVVPPSAVAIAVGTGLAVTVGASLLPALAATRVAPVAALGSQSPGAYGRAAHGAATRRPARAAWLRVAVACVSAGIGILLTVSGMGHVGGSAGFVEIAAGGCVCFVAVLALGPLIAPPVISWLSLGLLGLGSLGLRWGCGAGLRATVRLASANARRNPHRVAATTAALTIGVTLMTLFAVVSSSIQAATGAAIAGHYPFDYLVRAQGAQTVPTGVLRALAGSAKLGVVAPFYGGHAEVNGATTYLGAYGHNALGVAVRPAMVSGSLTSVGPGTAAVDSAVRPALAVGQSITVATPDAGRERLRVVAVYDAGQYKSPLPHVLISTADFLRGFRPTGADQVVIDAAHGVRPAVSRAEVSRLTASDPVLAVQTQADYKASLDSTIDHILELIGALLGLAVLIALLGISSTLTLSVIERASESALMRALGLTRGQLRLLLLTEALLMAVLAITLGIGLGVTFGLAMMHAFAFSAGGLGALSLPYASITLYAAAGICAALAAAILPARRAARTSVVAAMAAA